MKLVSLLGTSPGTPHTTLCKLLEKGIKPKKHIIVATSGASIREAQYILSNCPCSSNMEANIPVETIVLPFSDIESIAQLKQLRTTLSKILDTDTILDITGGRKLMAVAAALEALERGATIVSTIIPDTEYKRIASEKDPCKKTLPEKATLIKIL